MRKEFKKLDNAQKAFIETRVKELASINAVKAFYPTTGSKNCIVNRYANYIAKKELK